MARNPESARSISQFVSLPQIQDTEGNVIRQASITRIPDKRSKRSLSLGLERKSKTLKRSDFKSGQRPGSVRPKISERQHLSEGLSAPTDVVTAVNHSKPNIPEKVIVFADPQIHEQNGPFAGLSHKLSAKEQQDTKPLNPDDEQVDPDELREPVVVWSLEGMQEHVSNRVPGEEDGWDYASTAIDLRS